MPLIFRIKLPKMFNNKLKIFKNPPKMLSKPPKILKNKFRI